MIKRKFEKLGIETSLLGFGCMRFPLNQDGTIDEVESEKMVDYAIENGVNYLDTAWPYHGGKSESFVGKIIQKYKREELFVATKLPVWDLKRAEDVEEIFNKQLENLQTEYIDFYLVHAVNKKRLEDNMKFKIMEQLERFKQQGKIKYLGFSFHDDYEPFVEWVDLYDWDFVQIQLNYMDVDHQQGYKGYELLTEKGIPCVIMEPIKGGKLAGFRDDIEKPLKEHLPKNSISSWAFRWVGSLPNVKVVLSGMSTMDQVVDNVNTFSDFQPLSDDEYSLVNEVSKKLNNLQAVPCTDCKYCMPCEFGVNIPRNLNMHNEHNMYEDEKGTTWVVNMLKKGNAFADECTSCMVCVDKCPQNIMIPDELEIVKDKFSKFIK